MKFTVNVDCTPEEARQFLGLPDFAPMQEAVIAQMQEQVQKNMAAMDPESLMKMWLPANFAEAGTNGMQAFSDLQKMLWEQMTGAAFGQSGQSDAEFKRK